LIEEGVKDFSFALRDDDFMAVKVRNGVDGVIDLTRNRVSNDVTRSALRFDGPAACSEHGARFFEETCAPGGDFVVAVRNEGRDPAAIDGRLVLFSRGSGWIRVTSGALHEFSPEWGPRGTGVAFLRESSDQRDVEVWFIPEGGNPAPTPIRIPEAAEGIGYPWNWSDSFDWSATPPTGLPHG
jgi:hypothetical protein